MKRIDDRQILAATKVTAIVVLCLMVFAGILVIDADKPAHTVTVIKDEEQGCEYLVTETGDIAPRFDQDGKHICWRD